MKKIAMLLSVLMLVSMLASCGGSAGNKVVLADKSIEQIIDAIYAQAPVEIPLMTTPVDLTDEYAPSYYLGLTDVTGVKEAAASESAMGSQAYSLVIVRVEDAAKATEIAQKMKAGIDPRKWICVEADDMQVVTCGDLVVLAMVQSDLEGVSSQSLVDGFTAVCTAEGGTVTPVA